MARSNRALWISEVSSEEGLAWAARAVSLVVASVALVTALVALGERVDSGIAAGEGASALPWVLLDRRILAGATLAGLLLLLLVEEVFFFLRSPEPDDELVGREGGALFAAALTAFTIGAFVRVIVVR